MLAGLTHRVNRIFKKINRIQYRNELLRLASKIESLQAAANNIPVFIVSYNNSIYVNNMVNQFNHFDIVPIVIDNHSDRKFDIVNLTKLEQQKKAHVVFSKFNFGHMVGFTEPLYARLPEVFAYTDPDLQFSDKLPFDFLSQMIALTEQYDTFKVGFALPTGVNGVGVDRNKKIIKKPLRKPFIVSEREYSIEEWERPNWRYRLQHDKLELYYADIDTTFAVYNKANYRYNFFEGIRVAGDYSAIHLPWFPELDILNDADRTAYLKNNISSTWV